MTFEQWWKTQTDKTGMSKEIAREAWIKAYEIGHEDGYDRGYHRG